MHTKFLYKVKHEASEAITTLFNKAFGSEEVLSDWRDALFTLRKVYKRANMGFIRGNIDQQRYKTFFRVDL